MTQAEPIFEPSPESWTWPLVGRNLPADTLGEICDASPRLLVFLRHFG